MNRKTRSLLAIAVIALLLPFNIIAQCSINFCGTPTLSADPPVFNAANGSLEVNNINIGNIGCTAATYKTGLDIYIYQLLPDGSRVYQCNVQNPSPDNTIGNINVDFGQVNICGIDFNLGSIVADASNGFSPCDGATYEVEAVLYVTTNTTLATGNQTVYSQLSNSEFTSVNLGTVETDVSGTFPGNGQPLISSIIEDFATGNSGTITVNCGTDVDLYIEGLSRLANCDPYSDISIGIPSELENNLYYTVDGGSPISIQSPGSGSAGGQQTGPDAALSGLCYSGIYTDQPYVFPASNVPNACANGATVVITIETTDLYTNQTVTDQLTIVYTACTANLFVNNSPIQDNLYQAGISINSTGTVGNNGNVEFQAGQTINMNNNFEVPASADFCARIAPCN